MALLGWVSLRIPGCSLSWLGMGCLPAFSQPFVTKPGFRPGPPAAAAAADLLLLLLLLPQEWVDGRGQLMEKTIQTMLAKAANVFTRGGHAAPLMAHQQMHARRICQSAFGRSSLPTPPPTPKPTLPGLQSQSGT